MLILLISASISSTKSRIQSPLSDDRLKGVTGSILIKADRIKSYSNKQVCIAKLLKLQSKNVFLNGEKVLLNIFEDSQDAVLQEGKCYWLKGKFELISDSKIPSSFSKKDYYNGQLIFFQLIPVDNTIMLADLGNGIFSFDLATWRSELVAQFQKSLDKNGPAGILSAMILGDKTELNAGVKDIFRKSGVSHLLAVSGLHVGIMYIIIASLFSFLNTPKTKLLYVVMCIIFIWFYALLTGLSASVIRASFMFSLFSVGRSLYRKSNIYNIIACSAFFILLIQPEKIYNLGFLLSYSAVLSIVSIYPILNIMTKVSNIILKKIWASLHVSLAAQIGTLPILLTVFKTFPLYFLLGNLLAIPITFCLVLGGFVLLLVQSLIDNAPLEMFLADILNFLSKRMLEILSRISQLPYSEVHIGISFESSFLLVIAIVLMVFALYNGKKRLVFISLSTLLCVVLVNANSSEKKKGFYILNYRDNTCLGFYNNGEHKMQIMPGSNKKEFPKSLLKGIAEKMELEVRDMIDYKDGRREEEFENPLFIRFEDYNILYTENPKWKLNDETKIDMIITNGRNRDQFWKHIHPIPNILVAVNSDQDDICKLKEWCDSNKVEFLVLESNDFYNLELVESQNES